MLLECSQVQTSPSHCSAQCCAVFAHQTLPQDTASHSNAVNCRGRGILSALVLFPLPKGCCSQPWLGSGYSVGPGGWEELIKGVKPGSFVVRLPAP